MAGRRVAGLLVSVQHVLMERPKLTKSQSTLSEASADGLEESRDPNSRSNSDDEFGVAFAPNTAAPVAALAPVTEVRVGKFAARKVRFASMITELAFF